MVANLGEDEQTQKGKEVGDQQKEQAEVEATKEDDHEEEEEEEDDDQEDDREEEEDDNEDKTTTEHLKSIPTPQKMDTNYGLYYCSRCNFAGHLDCATGEGNIEDINLLELKKEESVKSKAMLENVDSKLDQFVDSKICKVIKTTMGEDGTEIATEIKHFSHKHDLKLTDVVPNNKICNGLILNTLGHACHEHPLYLSVTNNGQKCSICGFEQYRVFHCTTCEFVLDFKCATLPQTAWYNQHEHPFTLRYTPEDDYDEYCCDICEEERDSKQWFYYCEDCSYLAHSNCIIGEAPNYKEHI
ncbi:uncharacterized protein LOC126721648 [Quercus robur]|uniref:uncharacterized protein LOC126721648 n=1 Tax=Quercus robur TaxID=38942 RepID=UPI002163A385|nr:uncharacterized protein LOC126721648 [Quercus robur]